MKGLRRRREKASNGKWKLVPSAADTSDNVCVITAAAPNQRNPAEKERAGAYISLMATTILHAARHQDFPADVIILGPWGCGAFGNSLEEIAQAMRSALQELGSRFKEVHFALPELGGAGSAAQSSSENNKYWKKFFKCSPAPPGPPGTIGQCEPFP